MFPEQHLHNTQWLYFIKALSLFTSECEIIQEFELKSAIIRGNKGQILTLGLVWQQQAEK